MVDILEDTLGLHFQDASLLQTALTHISFIYERVGKGQACNERLEFLGDSILACITADFLYRTYPDFSQRILASTFEAVLGAIYLDQGLEAAREFLLPRIRPLANQIVEKRLFKDDKSRFQELAQAHDGITPVYRLAAQEGPSHDKEFTIEVLLGEQVAGVGQGRNKQTAEQAAASAALLQRGWL